MDFDLSQLQKSGFEFLDLEGACKAEIEILHNMLFNSQGTPQAQKLFHLKPNPNGDGNFLVDSNPISEDSDLQGDIPDEVVDTDPSVDSHIDDVGVEITEEPRTVIENGPVVTLSPHHQVIPLEPVGAEEVQVQNEISSNVMNQPQHHNMRSYYPPHQHVQVHGNPQVGPGGPGPAHMVNQGPQIPVSMYHQMLQGHAAYSMIHNGPPHGHSHPQHGAQTLYFVPQEPLSPEAVHLQNTGQGHHKNHHDPHHISHSPNTSGPGGPNAPNYARKNRRSDMRRHDDGLMKNPAYSTFYAPYGGMHYYSPQQQMAQNVTGPPIIMTHNGPHPANIYGSPYQHQPSGPHMYAQPPTGNEMDQHSGNMGPPSGHTHEIPSFAQQHQPVYHISNQQHGNRNFVSNRSSIPPPEQIPEQQPDLPTETCNESEVTPVTESAFQQGTSPNPNGSIGYTEDGIQEEELGKEEVSRGSNSPSPSQSCQPSEEPSAVVVNGEISPASSNAETSITPDVEPRMKEKVSNSVNSSKGNGEGKGEQKKESVVQQSQQLANGEFEKLEKDKLDQTRDKESADVITNTELVKAEVKSKSASSVNMSNNSRSVNVTNNSAAYPPVQGKSKELDKLEDSKETDGSTSQEFPQLAKMPNGTVTVAPVKGRSWASIASSKTSNVPLMNPQPTTGAPLIHNSDHNTSTHLDQMVFSQSDSKAFPANDSSGNTSHVPIIQEEKLTQSIDALPIDSSSLTDENDPIALRLGEFLATYTLDHHSLALSPRGLCNQSNFCYINATLQALLACPPFVNLFRSLRDILSKKPCKATPIIQSVFDFVSEFEPMLRGNNSKRERRNDAFCTGTNLEPTGIRKVLGLLEGSTFKVEGRQEDAEEFLSHLLNALHDEMIKVMKWAENRKERLSMKNSVVVSPVNTTQINGRLEDINGEEDDEDQWQVMGPKNKGCLTRKTAISKSPISETFLGQMCSALHRMNHTSTNFKSATLQPFYTLQLDIQNENIRSVRDALEGLSAKEELTGIVSNLGVEMEAWRQISLEDLPMVLILHLKRFVFEKSGNKIQKVDKKLDFGIDLEIGKDLLSVSSKTRYTLKQRQYKLFAVVYHDGEEAHKGHYVADCFHPSGGSMWGQCGWLRFDDTAVKQIPENQMLTSVPPRVPYLLYYRRADTLLSHATPNQQQQPKKERM